MQSASLRCVPPSPEVLSALYMDYIRDGKPAGLTFRQYLHAIGFKDPSVDTDGMDDGVVARPSAAGGPVLISVPSKPITGSLRVIVLLVDFDDQPGLRPRAEFEDLLFSDSVFPTGSMRDFYTEVTCGKVSISGSVHGWFRMPQKYDFYVNNESGMGKFSYPNSAQKMAEDAVAAAVAAGVSFPTDLDKLGNGTITALIVVHSGRGAEQLAAAIRKKHIWSHKWFMPNPATVGTGLSASTYLTIPEDCRMGVCAHELGHLAFQWEDFYDPNGNDDGITWSGSGAWDLMAAGSWNGGGNRPAHPAGLHKSQHGWITVNTVTATKSGVTLAPFTATSGEVLRILSPAFTPSQMLLLENRTQSGFDNMLPGRGLLVWRVDVDRTMTAPTRPALQLVQADGQGDLDLPPGVLVNQGDDGDPFPGSKMKTSVGDTGTVTTSFRDHRSGVTLSNISLNATTGVITLDIKIDPTPSPSPSPAGAAPIAHLAGGLAHDDLPSAQTPQAAALLEGLNRTLSRPNVSPTELQPFVDAVTPTPMDLERRANPASAFGAFEPRIHEHPQSPKASHKKTAATRGRAGKGGPKAFDTTQPNANQVAPPGFDSWLWLAYKATFGVKWDVKGQFQGKYTLEPRGPFNYLYRPDPASPFRFKRKNGDVIQPGVMMTDGGSVPRVAWLIPGIDPWTYIDAYVIHDWLFLNHHCDAASSASFEEANLTLAEAIYSEMVTGKVDADWRNVEIVYRAVSSFVGRGVWNREWDQTECAAALPNV